MENLKITKGEWKLGDLKISVWGENRKGCIADCTGIHNTDFYIGFEKEEQLANAKLIADAGTTYNKCETLPSELLKQKEDLVECLKLIYNTERLSLRVKCEIEELLNTLNK